MAGAPLESTPNRAADIRQVIGRQRASAPEWDTFRAHSMERQYRSLLIERLTITQVKLASTPPIRRDVPLLAFFYVIRGRFAVSRDGLNFTVAPGESVLLLSTGAYQYHLDDGEYLQCLVSLQAFDPLAIANVVGAIDRPVRPHALTRVARTLLTSLLDDPSDEGHDAITDSAAERIVAEALAHVAAMIIAEHGGAGARSSMLSAAFLYIDSQMSNGAVDLASMASALGTSSRTLSREFRAIGTTPMGALRDARLISAARRLASRTPLASFDQLAEDCGYADRTSLSRAFRRRYGLSPAEYRTRATSRPSPEQR